MDDNNLNSNNIILPPPPSPINSNEGVFGKPSKISIWAFVLGLNSLVCFGFIYTGIPAIIMGAMELRDIKKGNASEKGKTFAILGIILGGIGIIAVIIGYAILGIASSRNFLHRYFD